MKKIVKTEPKVEAEVKPLDIEKPTLGFLAENFGREDLNEIARKVNEIIKHLH